MTPAETLRNYQAAWNELDHGKRTALFERAFTAGGTYQDPNCAACGPAALSRYVAEVMRQFGDAKLTSDGRLERCDRHVLLGWKIAKPGGAILLKGMDFGELAADGRLLKIVGFFFDQTPSSPPV